VAKYLIFQGLDPRVATQSSPNCITSEFLRFGVLSRRSRYLISWAIKA
jgi:hypothetical protein